MDDGINFGESAQSPKGSPKLNRRPGGSQLLLPEEPTMGRSRSGSTASQADEWVLFISNHPYQNLHPHWFIQYVQHWTEAAGAGAVQPLQSARERPKSKLWNSSQGIWPLTDIPPSMTYFRSWKRWGSFGLTQDWRLLWRLWGWSRGKLLAPSTELTTSSWTSTSSRSMRGFHIWPDLSSLLQGDKAEHSDHREGVQGTACDSWIWRLHKRHHGRLWEVLGGYCLLIPMV